MNYITTADLVAATGEAHLLVLLQHRFPPTEAPTLAHPIATQALDDAIAAAQGIAEAELGRRFTPAQLTDAGKSAAVKACVVDLAIYRLSGTALPATEASESRYAQAKKDLQRIGQGLLSLGPSDPSQPPTQSMLMDSAAARGVRDFEMF